MTSRAAGAAVAAVVFASYLWTLYPTVAPRDSGDMAAAAVTLGVAHPPGYPLYAAAGRLWLDLLRVGDPAYRLNVLSALAGAAAAARLVIGLAPAAGVWPAVAAGLGLAWSGPVWKFNLLSEVYAFHALFLVLLLGLSMAPAKGQRRAALTGLLLGLGLVNHQSLILWVPGLAFLWRGSRGVAGTAAAFFGIGLALEAFLWIRLGSWGEAWACLTRRDYGTFQLFAPFARPLTLSAAGGLLAGWARAVAEGAGLAGVVLAAVGLAVGRRRDGLGICLLLGGVLSGPVYWLATRFDPTDWIARSALEEHLTGSFVALWAAAGLGLGAVLERVGRSRPLPAWAPPLLAALVAGASLVGQAPALDHRRDFAAHDYARSLRRTLAPGSAAVVAGDTAQFSLHYLEAARPRALAPLTLIPSASPQFGTWLRDRLSRAPVHAVGLGIESLRANGLWGNPLVPIPNGLAARLGTAWGGDEARRREAASWEVTVHRPGRALERGDSYSRDVRFSYAYACYLSGLAHETFGRGAEAARLSTVFYVHAAAFDPVAYGIEPVPAAGADSDLKQPQATIP